MSNKNIIRCHKIHLEERCKQRGVDLKDAMHCVVFRNNDIWDVDTSHSSYPKAPKGLGDYFADGLARFGVTPERVSKLIGKDCGCKERKERLNKLGEKFGVGRTQPDIKRNRKV